MNRSWAILAAVMLGTVGAVVLTDVGPDPLEEDGTARAVQASAAEHRGLASDDVAPLDETDNASQPTSTDPSFEEFTMVGCRETFAHLEVPQSRLEGELPSGFEPIPSPFTPGVGARPTGWFVAVTSHCERIVFDGPTTEETTVDDNQRLWYAAAVDPPDAFEDSAVDVYFYPFRFVVSQDASGLVLADWGQHVESGEIDFTRQAPEGQQPWTWDVRVDSEDVAFEQGARGAYQLDFHDPRVRLFAHPSDGSVDHAIDMQPQGNTVFSWASQLDLDLDAPDSPFPGPAPREPVQGNLKVTPSGEVALHGDLVTFDGS